MDLIASGLDIRTIFWIQQHIVTGALTPLMIFLSNLANAGAIWALFGVVLCFCRKYRSIGITIIIALLAVGILGDGLLKHWVMRARPCIDYPGISLAIPVPRATDYSFPSGHSYASFAAATVLYLYHKKWGIPALLLAGAIAFSRVYLFVHYPSDVVAGAMFGVATAIACMMLVKHFETVGLRNKKFWWNRPIKKEK